MNSCIFCQIANHKLPAYQIYEDENFLAFLDINPKQVGHTLIIPKVHSDNFLEMDASLDAEFNNVVKKLAINLKEGFKADGIKIITNNGASSGQEIFHTHVHIIPYYNRKISLKNYIDTMSEYHQNLQVYLKSIK